MAPEVVASGIGFGEGPVWRPDEGDLVVTSISDGVLYRVDPSSGAVEGFADTAGGPNGAVLRADGGLVVAQNGGLDLRSWAAYEMPPPRKVAPGLQLVSPTGEVTAVPTAHPLRAPNDLAVDADGTVVFTELLRRNPAVNDGTWQGKLWRYDGVDLTLIEELDHWTNGIAEGPAGLLTAEADGLRWLRGGDRSWLSPTSGQTDGFAVDADGRAYSCQLANGIAVVDTDGTVVERLPVPDGSTFTNCCFGGTDLRTLYATDVAHGTVLAWEGLPTAGHPLRLFTPRR